MQKVLFQTLKGHLLQDKKLYDILLLNTAKLCLHHVSKFDKLLYS